MVNLKEKNEKVSFKGNQTIASILGQMREPENHAKVPTEEREAVT